MANAETVPTKSPLGNHRRVRVFVGLKVAAEIAGELAQLARGLEHLSARAVRPADIHVTVVPPWEEASTSEAIAKLCSVAGEFSGFSLTFKHVSYGPQLRRPHLLWVECMANEEIVALRAALLQTYGQHDDRPFRPHVTLARLGGHGSAIARRHPIDQDLSFTQRVESVELFQSPHPGESGYQILASARLGQPSRSGSRP
jgi:2'-5' RNA ligase